MLGLGVSNYASARMQRLDLMIFIGGHRHLRVEMGALELVVECAWLYTSHSTKKLHLTAK